MDNDEFDIPPSDGGSLLGGSLGAPSFASTGVDAPLPMGIDEFGAPVMDSTEQVVNSPQFDSWIRNIIKGARNG